MSSATVLSSASAPASPTSRPGWVDVDRLESARGVVAVISQRPATGQLTYCIFREFPRRGETHRTGFIPEEMLADHIDMIRMVQARMQQLRETGELPYPGRCP